MKSSGSLNVRYRLRNEVGEALTKFLAEAVTAGVKVVLSCLRVFCSMSECCAYHIPILIRSPS